MEGKLDLLNYANEKDIYKQLKSGGTHSLTQEQILLSSPIFKFNDYKKKQERNILVTNCRVYNCKDTSKPVAIQPSKGKLKLTK